MTDQRDQLQTCPDDCGCIGGCYREAPMTDHQEFRPTRNKDATGEPYIEQVETSHQEALPDHVRNVLLQCARRVLCSHSLGSGAPTCEEWGTPPGLQCPNCEWRREGLTIARNHA